MIVTKKHLDRRTFLRGCGVALSLPLLDSMVPALKADSGSLSSPPTRLSVVYVPNGIMMDQWTPAAEGAAFALPSILQPLADWRSDIVLLSGLSHMEALALPGEGAGDHARASATYLTGVHPNKTEGADLHNGISLDQIAARELAAHTQLASLEMALDSTETLGACEPGYSCAYTNTLSWRTPTEPLPMENHPRAVFEHLFGDSNSTDPKERLARVRQQRSILDFVSQSANTLLKQVGPADGAKVNEYLDAIRDVERRIQVAERQSARDLPVVERPAGIPATFKAHAELMYDLQVLAFQCDLTRVVTFMKGHEQTVRSYNEIGIAEAHHPLSHHGGDPDKMAKVAKINQYHISTFAYFLNKLKSTREGNGTLLDHVAILYGSGLSDGNMHRHDSLPALLAGGAAGKIKGGRHIRFAKDTSMPRLYGTLLDLIGVPLDRLTTVDGKLEPLSLA
ncbi:MAG TPA: DUF1552 domain-containing protein [Bryobacteraceae bacterium]|jgi:hypothetical protein|nr:DUF1552 domain-containing protein [Bryobacteraceae bacterium]